MPLVYESRVPIPHGYRQGMRREVVAGTVLIVALCSVVGYASYRIARQSVFARGGRTSPTFASACPAHSSSAVFRGRPVVTFGDSITEGYGATSNCVPPDMQSVVPTASHLVHSRDTSYPGDLARLLHEPVLNYGADDETTSEGLSRLQRVLGAIQPSSVVLMEGASDLMAGQEPLAVAYRLLRMAAMIRESGARPILLTVIPTDGPHWTRLASRIKVLNGLLRAGARSDHVTLADTAAAFAAHKPLAGFFRQSDGRGDGLHPNDSGYRVLAVLVYQELGHT